MFSMQADYYRCVEKNKQCTASGRIERKDPETFIPRNYHNHDDHYERSNTMEKKQEIIKKVSERVECDKLLLYETFIDK